eukprot:CAMPEP_0175847846 /NCGR_PEP_ID=MMETSP0107_2-20121207/23583_1 /TAXON_ID=195067 ORGANISM="Goniomonas pacifica, Strain CCMP1869" /NCGR_SAMPLE_ID=MMETSP0107_2 /ASSEMBLY_ACC=CAM_ASM_000203 /LENGTH=311 /DNA_ID=CAMNT_0017162713 /DNA_START=261 /DNA_END=1199 /DNA_ORIENTATION=-
MIGNQVSSMHLLIPAANLAVAADHATEAKLVQDCTGVAVLREAHERDIEERGMLESDAQERQSKCDELGEQLEAAEARCTEAIERGDELSSEVAALREADLERDGIAFEAEREVLESAAQSREAACDELGEQLEAAEARCTEAIERGDELSSEVAALREALERDGIAFEAERGVLESAANHGMVKSSPLRIGCHSSPDGSRLHKNSHSSSFVVADRPSPPEALPCRRCSWRSWGSVRRVAICLAARRPYLKLPNGNSRSFITQRAAHRDRMSQLALRIAKKIAGLVILTLTVAAAVQPPDDPSPGTGGKPS